MPSDTVSPATVVRNILVAVNKMTGEMEVSGASVWAEVLGACAGEDLVDNFFQFTSLFGQAADSFRSCSDDEDDEDAIESVFEFHRFLVSRGYSSNLSSIRHEIKTSTILTSLLVAKKTLGSAGHESIVVNQDSVICFMEELENLRREIEADESIDIHSKRELRVILAHVRSALNDYRDFGWGGVESCLRDLMAYLAFRVNASGAEAERADDHPLQKCAKWALGKYSKFHIVNPALKSLPSLADGFQALIKGG